MLGNVYLDEFDGRHTAFLDKRRSNREGGFSTAMFESDIHAGILGDIKTWFQRRKNFCAINVSFKTVF